MGDGRGSATHIRITKNQNDEKQLISTCEHCAIFSCFLLPPQALLKRMHILCSLPFFLPLLSFKVWWRTRTHRHTHAHARTHKHSWGLQQFVFCSAAKVNSSVTFTAVTETGTKTCDIRPHLMSWIQIQSFHSLHIFWPFWMFVVRYNFKRRIFDTIFVALEELTQMSLGSLVQKLGLYLY